VNGNRLPTGPGSRGGVWHLPGYKAVYQRAWRAAHPEYREREKLRMARARNGDPAGLATSASYPRPLPEAARFCTCGCECREPVPTRCGFCRDGLHWGDTRTAERDQDALDQLDALGIGFG